MQSKNLLFWNWFAVFYISLALLLLTLIPFDFKWLAASRHMQWEVEFQDIIQNLYLFFPLGVLLAHTLKRSLLYAVLPGTLLSAVIEIIQLSDIGRSSNYCDIISNSLSTLLGALYYRFFVCFIKRDSLDISLVFMLMPMCWFIAMRSAKQELMAWLVMPIVIVAISIFKSVLQDKRFKGIALVLWLIFSLTPLLYMSRDAIFLTLFNLKITPGIVIFVVAIALINLPSSLIKFNPRFHLMSLLLTTILIFTVNIKWYFTKKSPILWTVPAHLHWIDSLMSFLVLMFAVVWFKQKTRYVR